MLTLRRDLLPDEYIAELERLNDRLLPMDIEVVRSTIERELGGGSTCTLDLESSMDFHLIQHFHKPRELLHKRSGERSQPRHTATRG